MQGIVVRKPERTTVRQSMNRRRQQPVQTRGTRGREKGNYQRLGRPDQMGAGNETVESEHKKHTKMQAGESTAAERTAGSLADEAV